MRPELRSAPLDRGPQLGTRNRDSRCSEGVFKRMQEAGLAREHVALRPNDRQRQERVVARKTWKESGAEKRRFACARGAENRQQPRRRSVAQPAQRIECLNDLGIAAEEDAGIVAFEGPQASIGWPI